MEYFWVVDECDRVLGKATREECHKDNRLIHRSVYIFLINSRNQLFLQKRSESKDLYPGYFTGSATGHVDYGETYDQAARRELEEELGVEAPFTAVSKFKSFSNIEREISMLYACYFNGDVTFNRAEVSQGIFMDIAQVKMELEQKAKKFAYGFEMAFKEYVRATRL